MFRNKFLNIRKFFCLQEQHPCIIFSCIISKNCLEHAENIKGRTRNIHKKQSQMTQVEENMQEKEGQIQNYRIPQKIKDKNNQIEYPMLDAHQRKAFSRLPTSRKTPLNLAQNSQYPYNEQFRDYNDENSSNLKFQQFKKNIKEQPQRFMGSSNLNQQVLSAQPKQANSSLLKLMNMGKLPKEGFSNYSEIKGEGKAKTEYNKKSLLQIDKELKVIKKGFKTHQRSNHENQKEEFVQLVNIEKQLTDLPRGSNKLEDKYQNVDQELQEQFKEMLSEVKRRSQMYRKSKEMKNDIEYRSEGFKNLQKSSRINPSNRSSKSSFRKEKEVNHSYDLGVIKQYMDQSQNAIFLKSDKSLPKVSRIRNGSNSQFEKSQLKIVKLNFLEEYKSHLKVMSKLKHFAQFKLYWDHAFFRNYIQPQQEDIEQKPPDVWIDSEEFQEMMKNKYSKSLVSPVYHSYLENFQEKQILAEQIEQETEKQEAAVFFETKSILETYIKKKEILSSKQEEKEISLPNLRKFFFGIFETLQRMMKSSLNSSKDYVYALTLDNLFKAVMLKIDDIMSNNERLVDEAIEMQKYWIKQMKLEAEKEIEAMETQIYAIKKQKDEEIKELKERLELTTLDKLKYQALFEKSEGELACLMNADKRQEKMEDLKDYYTQINMFLMEAEDEHTKQVKLIEEYTKLIRQNLRHVQKADKGVQTTVELAKFNSSEFNEIMKNNKDNNKNIELVKKLLSLFGIMDNI